eukprot:GGOE01035395.1.p1 GENE.GGOE01035395.1~~GGOE01035395.1.p1  ORF type:complete len:150 (-),score=0.68 GGOE01035395.1:426-875(-)
MSNRSGWGHGDAAKRQRDNTGQCSGRDLLWVNVYTAPMEAGGRRPSMRDRSAPLLNERVQAVHWGGLGKGSALREKQLRGEQQLSKPQGTDAAAPAAMWQSALCTRKVPKTWGVRDRSGDPPPTEASSLNYSSSSGPPSPPSVTEQHVL